MKLVTKYDLGAGAGEPAGLGLDVKNGILFAMSAEPNVCVVLNAADGKVLKKLPLVGAVAMMGMPVQSLALPSTVM